MEEILTEAGFTKNFILFSFTPKFIKQSGGYYWSKNIPYDKGNNDISIGVLLNTDYNSMEVYICDCVIGCCGQDMGIHPFGLEKIEELVKQYLK